MGFDVFPPFPHGNGSHWRELPLEIPEKNRPETVENGQRTTGFINSRVGCRSHVRGACPRVHGRHRHGPLAVVGNIRRVRRPVAARRPAAISGRYAGILCSAWGVEVTSPPSEDRIHYLEKIVSSLRGADDVHGWASARNHMNLRLCGSIFIGGWC